jgi:hypothetical protein
MNLCELEKKLIAAARSNPPSDGVPYAFEKRITSLLGALPVLDRWTLWSRALWRGAAGCLVAMILLGTGSFFIPQTSDSPGDLSQEFENTMLASADQYMDNIW